MKNEVALQDLVVRTMPGRIIAAALIASMFLPQGLLVAEEVGAEQSVETASSEGLEGGGGEMSLLLGESAIPDSYLFDIDNLLRNSRIDESSGAFTYAIPIVIPPGRNEMQPELVLTYSSQREEDQHIAGYGWNIPLPFIERQNKIGVENLFSTNIIFSSISGELATTSNESVFFAKSDDGSFTKYEYASSTNQWTAKTKDGHVYKFGYATTSQVFSVSTTTHVSRWIIDEERDTNSNYIKYEYFKDNSFAYPAKITYTGNGTTTGLFTVEFNRESRPDSATSSVTSFKTAARYRLNEIVASIEGQWVRKYQLAYTAADNDRRSLLQSVTESGRTEIGSTTTTFPATTFSYKTAIPGWSTTTSNFALPQNIRKNDYGDAGTRIADVNGDALIDIVFAPVGTTTKIYINNGTGWTYNASWQFPVSVQSPDGGDGGVRLVDLNGDGLTDIVKRETLYPSFEQIILQYLNTGSGWATTTNWQLPQHLIHPETREDLGVRLADVNGDGLTDILIGQYNQNAQIVDSKIYLNSGHRQWLHRYAPL